MLDYERRFWAQGVSQVAGVDEAGRGPLAGPVVAAAVVLPQGVAVEGAADSKSLAPGEREEIEKEVRRHALALAIGAASAREIDRVNILRATTLAMRRALGRLPAAPGHVVVDGLPVRGLEWDHDAVVGGDARVHSIACASVVAKVCRDRLMSRLAVRYPDYGWDTNKGYATRRHRQAVRRKGVTPHHRLSFGLRQIPLPLDFGAGSGFR